MTIEKTVDKFEIVSDKGRYYIRFRSDLLFGLIKSYQYFIKWTSYLNSYSYEEFGSIEQCERRLQTNPNYLRD